MLTDKTQDSPLGATQGIALFKERVKDIIEKEEWDFLNKTITQETSPNRQLYFSFIWQESESNIKHFLDNISVEALDKTEDWVQGVSLPILRRLLSKANHTKIVHEMIEKRMVIQVNSIMDDLNDQAREFVVTHPYVLKTLKKYKILKNIDHFKKVAEQKKELNCSLEGIKKTKIFPRSKM